MRVYIIGAGPGDPKLLTVRALELIAACPVVLYTGSLVPRQVLEAARPDAQVIDSSGMTLDEIIDVIAKARDDGCDVARVHTGDPLIFGSTAEQMRRLEELGIPYEVVPGVSSFTAAAAVLGRELTLPELCQTVILTRAEGRTPVPEGEKLAELARHRATMALFLSVRLIDEVVPALTPAYGADCPVAVVHKATWKDQKVVLGTLADIASKVKEAGIRSQSMVLVGRVLTANDFANSRVYDPEFAHRFRRAKSRADSRADASEDSPERGRADSRADASEDSPERGRAGSRADASEDSPERGRADSRADASEDSPERGRADSRADASESPPERSLPGPGAKREQKGLLLVYTGNGKGKTTAALGLVFRALGRGLRAAVVQFIKGKWKTGEHLFAQTLPNLTFLVMGEGFTWESEDLGRDRRAAAEAWDAARSLIAAGEHHVVVLDEITYALNYGFVSVDDVVETLRSRPAHVHVALTGRNAPETLCALADLVTEMKALKHPFEQGLRAQPAVDY